MIEFLKADIDLAFTFLDTAKIDASTTDPAMADARKGTQYVIEHSTVTGK